MYKVMLVEDEPPILNMIKDIINSYDNDFHVCFTAYNGRDALKHMEKNIPEVLITDIRMPFVDGLELISKVNELYPDVICIILSGFSDFEYARSAIRLNVFDYLLKPIQLSALKNLFSKIKDILDQKKSELEYELLNAMINYPDAKITENLNFRYSEYYILIAYAGPLSNQLYDLINSGRDFWNTIDFNVFLNHVHNRNEKIWMLNGKYLNEKIFVIGSENRNLELTKQLGNELLNFLKNDSIPVNIIESKAFISPSEIGATIKRLTGILSREIIFAHSNIFFEEEKKFNTVFITPEIEKRFVNLIQNNKYDAFKKAFKALVNEWEEMKYAQIVLQTLLNYLVNLFQAQKGKIDTNLKEIYVNVNEILTNSMNYSDLYENFCVIFKNFYELCLENSQNNRTAKELVDKIENYLIENYTKNITYKVFYELFGYNEAYITNLFRNIKGISPSKYITKLRIEKAKELILRQPDILLKNVSEMLGYDDPLYFSRVFKDLTGFSPREYAKGIVSQKSE